MSEISELTTRVRRETEQDTGQDFVWARRQWK